MLSRRGAQYQRLAVALTHHNSNTGHANPKASMVVTTSKSQGPASPSPRTTARQDLIQARVSRL